ncbi:hypothetical protein CFOL_v3_15769 [Cephalotus follicularis]|uniref:Uncharacterized protein n=1 Tax=Cephalotus follicularis TaxID=3775 RepID=A0A1Q3BWI5_CEPFO|nr:hypothetical protein CFOL_v3_15769 [Cephalotus follicularis]
MAVSLNSVVGFNSMLHVKYRHVWRSSIGASGTKATQSTFPSRMFCSRRHRIWGLCLSVADSDQLATDTNDKGSGEAAENSQFKTSVDNQSGPKTSVVANGSVVSSDLKEVSSSTISQSTPKKSSLTARERLRAARILSRNTEPKASKSEMGSKVLEALRESDRGKKKSRLPEAPTNLFDDSKRGMPKQGLTFDFPGGFDLFIIAFSFVFISTVMFATTYIVWKVGAIHFNEY